MKRNIGLDDLATLKGIATAIEDGDTTVEQAFPAQPKAAGTAPASAADKKGVAGLAERVANAKGATAASAAAAPAPLHIVELQVSNLKRLKAVQITPDGDLVVLSGQNGAGKSSVLDAIAMALGGRDQIPAEPIRRGADRAEVLVDLGEILVRRTFTTAIGGQVVVQNRAGARFQSPQSMLDEILDGSRVSVN